MGRTITGVVGWIAILSVPALAEAASARRGSLKSGEYDSPQRH